MDNFNNNKALVSFSTCKYICKLNKINVKYKYIYIYIYIYIIPFKMKKFLFKNYCSAKIK